jgi:type III secretion protein C
MPPIVARDMPLQEFMQALFAPQAINVIVSPAAAQRVVNGRFTGSAAKAFNTVVVSSSLLPYFDGGSLYLYASTETQRKVINVPPASAQRLVSTLVQMRLHDGRYNLFTAVPASGFIQVTGAKPFVDQIQEVARSVQLSAPSSPEQIAVFPLQHAWAWDITLESAGKSIVVPGVASLLRTLLGGNGSVSITPPAKSRASVQRLGGKGFASGVQTDGMAEADAAASALAAAGAAERSEEVQRNNNPNGPTVTAEVRSNSVIVRDAPDRLPRYADLIKALDVEPLMIELETTIVDVNNDQLQQLGVNWRQTGNKASVLQGNGTSSDLALQRGTPLPNITPTGLGLTWSTVLNSGNLLARISALASDGTARVVSRAQVATLANLESAISSTQTGFVKVGGFQSVDLFPVTATTSVRITPQVFTRGSRSVVSMVVAIRDGSFTESLSDQVPSVREISLSTNGLVAENQTFVIGGFRQESTTNSVDKVPFLGDIPLLGALFRTSNQNKSRSERLFFVTPRIITVSKLLDMASADINASLGQTDAVPSQSANVPAAAPIAPVMPTVPVVRTVPTAQIAPTGAPVGSALAAVKIARNAPAAAQAPVVSTTPATAATATTAAASVSNQVPAFTGPAYVEGLPPGRDGAAAVLAQSTGATLSSAPSNAPSNAATSALATSAVIGLQTCNNPGDRPGRCRSH